MSRGRSLIDRFYELLGTGDVADLTGLYGDGVLQSTHVVVLATDGTIHRHVPHMRGYWGS